MEVQNHVTASSFADPSDVRRYRAAKARGASEQEALSVGDNAIGCWGDDTSMGSGPSCALPPEVMIQNWGSVSGARYQQVLVTKDNKSVVCVIKDRMPHLEDIHNSARIDLNPDAVMALGMEPPMLATVIWQKHEVVDAPAPAEEVSPAPDGGFRVHDPTPIAPPRSLFRRILDALFRKRS